MQSWLALLVLAGCGRVAFEATHDAAGDAPAGHDEDADGLVDDVDPCPHLAGDAADGDGDGVGDACDPAPGTGGEQLVQFWSFTPDDLPFPLAGGLAQEADAVHWVGEGGLPLAIAQPVASGRIELGFEIRAIVGAGQHQIAYGVDDGSQPFYFIELNENGTNQTFALVSFDGTTYSPVAAQPHGGMHPGRGLLRLDASVSPPNLAGTGGWTDELYTAQGATAGYTGGSQLRFALNGLDVALRYLIVISAP